ncbi:unnamed protein product [Somion occarium]|uniref:BHLH domain-containing protein n=1 Tax=Somion occarium TaxID=3059160 RepID=A0ABP1DL91_9APHY
MTTFYNSYKPQVLSRTEGFHLPSPAPSTPPSTSSDPSNNQASSSSPTTTTSFDAHNLFLSPPSYLSVPETFRKFPASGDHIGSGGSNMDFSEELASLMVHPSTNNSSNTSHERSTQSPGSYDDYRAAHTHNIFDISAPTTHHQQQQHHPSHSHHSSHHPHHAHSQSYGSSSSFGVGPGGSATSPLHDFSSHSHFNSTVPAIGSSMRYEPPPQSPFNLNPNAPTTAGGEPSSVSSFSSHISTLSSFSGLSNTTTTTTPSSEYHPHQYSHSHQQPQRQTPSPISTELSRSRSRSRSQVGVNGVNGVNGEPPSTNGGPARRTRAKRGSVSSVSPPPLHRGAQPLVIPGTSAHGRGPASPLSLHTNGWGFLGNGTGPGSASGNAPNGVANGEFSLPTPESVHGGFPAFNGALPSPIAGLAGSIGLGGINVGSLPSNGAGANGTTGKGDGNDVASKQALLANEKRRRRRESHNAVERRRRDNINEKISELATLIPEHLLDPAASTSSPTALNPDDVLGGSPGLDEDEKEVKDKEGKESKESKESREGKEKDGAAGVKANKGMILRKSVEYIRYLQQLVSAQATRNRDLEQQLQAFKSGSPPSSSTTEDLAATDDAFNILPSSSPTTPSTATAITAVNTSATCNSSSSPLSSSSSSTPTTNTKRRSKAYTGFDQTTLESVVEMDTEDDHHHGTHAHANTRDEDEEMDLMMEGTSPSVGDGDGDEDDNDGLGLGLGLGGTGEEEERGRKGRPLNGVGGSVNGINGMGVGGVSGSGKVKVKEEGGDMETS